MLALTLVDSPSPIPIGLKSWRTLRGMMATPRAILSRSQSGSTPSTAATYLISSVTLPRFACSICVMGLPSVRRLRRPHLADDRDLDPPRILHLSLDLLGQLRSQQHQMIVVDFAGICDDPDLAPGLDRVGVFHTLDLVRQPLELFDALDVVDDALAARPRTRPGDGVGRGHQHRDRVDHVGVFMVLADRV